MAEKDWDVVFDDEFQAEFDAYDEAVQDKILARAGLLRQFGPIFQGLTRIRWKARNSPI